MIHDLGRLDCRICGRPMYFLLADIETEVGAREIELTCSRGHSDSYLDAQCRKVPEVTAPRTEMVRALAVGF